VNDDELLRRRLTAQQLAGPPADDARSVARRLLAVQAQDGRAARLAIRARAPAITVAEIDSELTQERSVLVTWLNRGTLHLIAAEDYPLLQALTTPPLWTANNRRLEQEGVSPAMADRAVTLVGRALADEGPLTRDALRDRLRGADVAVAGQALVHIMFRCALEGLAIRGPMVGKQHAFVRVQDWLGSEVSRAVAAIDRDGALAELARRYLAGHGPASERDLARWAGLPLRDARAGLSAIASDLRDEGGGLVDLAARARMAPLPVPRLLGGWEPLLVGWCSRAFVLRKHDPDVVTGGLFRNFALVEGQGVASWKLEAGSVTLTPFADVGVDDAAAAALAADARAVERFLDGAG
jgi:hypothetical protein